MTFNPAMGESLDRSIELAEERLRHANEMIQQGKKERAEASEEVRTLRMRRTRYDWWAREKSDPYAEAWGLEDD